MLIVSTIALVTTAVLSFNFAQNTLKEGVENQLVGESTIRGEAVRTLFYTRIKDIQVLSTGPMIHNLVSELNSLHDESDFDLKLKEKKRDFFTEVKAFRELVGYSIGLADVKIIGKDGTVYFSLGKIENPNFSKDSQFVRGLTQPSIELEPTFQGGHEMVIVTPIFNAMGVSTMKNENPRARKDVLLKRIVDETLVYDPVTEHIHVINQLSTSIWELLDGSKNAQAIEQCLIPQFEKKIKNLKEEIQLALKFFSDKGLLEQIPIAIAS